MPVKKRKIIKKRHYRKRKKGLFRILIEANPFVKLLLLLGLIAAGFSVYLAIHEILGPVKASNFEPIKNIPEIYTNNLEVISGNSVLTVRPLGGNSVKVRQEGERYIYEEAYKTKVYDDGSTCTITATFGAESKTVHDTSYATQSGRLSLQNHYGSYTRYDDVRVRKYAVTEPAFSSADAEESLNAAPTITSVKDFPDPVKQGDDVTFSVDWNDTNAEGIKMLVCKTNAITAATPCCDGGEWCSNKNDYDSTDPIVCTYTTTSSELGSNDYYVFVCDDEPTCSSSTSGSFTVEPLIDSSIKFPGGAHFKGGTIFK